MDELLYFLALAAGIVGGLSIWQYSRSRKRAAARAVRQQKKDSE